MADASCGSSNPFKGLARHIEQDRSHQQDRVTTGPQHFAQGFRSQHFTSDASDQFDAFQRGAELPPLAPAGLGPLPSPLYNPVQAPPSAPLLPAQNVAGIPPNASSGWINEFQRMSSPAAHVHPAHPQHAYQSPNMGQPSSVHPMYPNAFSQHPIVGPLQPPPPFQAFQPFQPSLAGHYPTGPDIGTLGVDVNRQTPQFIDDASSASNAQDELEQEFEDAMHEWMLQNGPAAEMSDQGQLSAESIDESMAKFDNITAGLDDLTLSLDAATAESTAQEKAGEDISEPEQSDAELARVAQQLVDCFADNQSEKFKNSEFLAVMRRIASRQLTVKGNDLVEAEPKPSSD
ncbi:hypothetical protein F4861DRAFT_508809 [Xylaria intraflava]|nr:hypothetical protein F4861DRAFT_508809 [Xylaria intraflava]